MQWITNEQPEYSDKYEYAVLATVKIQNKYTVKALCPVFDKKTLVFYGDPITNETYDLKSIIAWMYYPDPYKGE